jgi:hypothetical protein
MKPYAIARYLNDEERRRAVGAEYSFFDVTHERLLRTVVDGRHLCPLAVALKLTVSPDSRSVARRLKRTGWREYAIRAAASTFIVDVDSGRIRPDEIALALGVTP